MNVSHLLCIHKTVHIQIQTLFQIHERLFKSVPYIFKYSNSTILRTYLIGISVLGCYAQESARHILVRNIP